MKAVALGQKLAFLRHFNLVSFFFIVTSVKSKNRLSFALLTYMFLTVLPHDVFEQTQVRDSFKCRSENVLSAIMDTACYTLVTLRKLLLRIGDIEANPGPSIPGLICVLYTLILEVLKQNRSYRGGSKSVRYY